MNCELEPVNREYSRSEIPIGRKSPILKSGMSSNAIISGLLFRHLAVDLRLPVLAGMHPVGDEGLEADDDAR